MGTPQGVQPDQTLTSEQVARLLGTNTQHVRAIALSLGGVKVRGRWQFSEQAVTAHLERRRNTIRKAERNEAIVRVSIVGAVVVTSLVWIGFTRLGDSGPKHVAPPSPTPVRLYQSPAGGNGPGFVPHAVCQDGTISVSIDRQGTCSWHGGVSRWVTSP